MRQIDAYGRRNASQNLNSPSETPRISIFPGGHNPWRIDWFGNIAFPDRGTRRKQPSVLVYLSRVNSEAFHDNPAVLLSPDSTAPTRFQRSVWVSVGTLPLLRVGDVWRDRELEVRPDYELETFPDIQIGRSNTDLIKAGLNLDNQGYLLPLAEHPWHMHGTQSYCVMVSLPDGRRLIIPCIEMIRFYFGSSSSLITKLFLPPLTRDVLYSDATRDPRSGHLMLKLAEKISGASAADIGRLHVDPVAWRAAVHVGASALKASVADQAIYPQALFPFEGRTTLVAAGKWLSFAGEPRSTFLVYSLRSCAHPFPFNSLRYEIEVTDPVSTASMGGVATSRAHPMRAAARDAKNQPLVEHDASNNLAPKTKQLRFEQRFPDLTPKSIWKSKSLAHQDQTARNGANVPDVETAAVGDAGSERRIRPLDLALAAAKNDVKPHEIPPFLWETVHQLRFLEGVTADLLTESDHDGWTVPISILSDEDGEIDARMLISEQDGTSRLRRASVFAFQRDREHVCAVVIESEPARIKLYPTTGQDSEEVWKTLRCAAVDFLKGTVDDADDFSFADLIHWVFGIDLPTVKRR